MARFFSSLCRLRGSCEIKCNARQRDRTKKKKKRICIHWMEGVYSPKKAAIMITRGQNWSNGIAFVRFTITTAQNLIFFFSVSPYFRTSCQFAVTIVRCAPIDWMLQYYLYANLFVNNSVHVSSDCFQWIKRTKW